MRNLSLIIAFIIALIATACNNNSNVVVVYTTVDQIFSEPVLKEFESGTGITVKAVYDTEETKSTGVLNRLIAEKDNPQCDVFWSGDPVRTIVLKSKHITTPSSHRSPMILIWFLKTLNITGQVSRQGQGS